MNSIQKTLLAFSLVFYCALSAQHSSYWQQEAHYTMELSLDHTKHQITGKQSIRYVNNSPDTLRRMYIHLYFNSFKPGSRMDQRCDQLPDPDGRIAKRIKDMSESEIGFQKINDLRINGESQSFSVDGSLLRMDLNHAILPGEEVLLETQFDAQVPKQIRRSGRNNSEGVEYTMTQWYPKIAEYSPRGWHTQQYVNREFFGVFGSFDVKIEIDSKFVLAGTGEIVNACELDKKVAFSYCSEAKNGKEKRQTWHFKAEDVHDFAWAADRDFLVKKTLNNEGTPVYFVRKKDTDKEAWDLLEGYTHGFFTEMKNRFGQYPYPQFSVIQGGDGGMEYPMCTMILGRSEAKDIKGMVGLVVHEAAHNWFYGIIATDEQQYPWMDEGFTTFAEEEVMNVLFEENQQNPHFSSLRAYRYLVEKGWQEPLSTPADHYMRNRAYGVSSYSMGSLYLTQLEYIVGEEVFRRSIKQYFNVWKFKHPSPDDLLFILERNSGMQLHWFHDLWIGTTQKIDYEIVGVNETQEGKLSISLKNGGSFPMPLSLEVVLRSGKTERYYIPVDLTTKAKQTEETTLPTWPWTQSDYAFEIEASLGEIESIRIDKEGFMADINEKNNLWPVAKD